MSDGLKDKRGRKLQIPGVDYKVGKGRPPLHSRIKPGEIKNPTGKNDTVKRALTLLTQAELRDIANLLVQGSVSDLRAIAKDPGSSTVKVMVAALAARVIQKGDTVAFDKLMDRLVGPVKQKMELTGKDGAPLAPPASVVLYLPKNGQTKGENGTE